MYQTILDALYGLNNLNSDAQKAAYLQSLQEPARALWLRYQNQYITVDYADATTQAAYMLRYFPQYSQIVKIVFNELKEKQIIPIQIDGKLNCALFGSGPCPEAYGIINYLNSSSIQVNNVSFLSFDINATNWSFSRNVVSNSLIPTIWADKQYQLNGFDLDISLPITLNGFDKAITKMNVIVFQNCLNEINPARHPQVLENLSRIYSLLPENSLMLIIDLSGFKNVMNLLNTYQQRMKTQFVNSVISPLENASKRYFAAQLVNTMPQILRTNLLNGSKENQNGLIPRINIDYHTLIIRK